MSEPREHAATPGAGAPAIARWQAADCPFAVEYPAELMVHIRKRAVENFHAVANGGLEVGGVLFGRVWPNARMMQRVELVSERPIDCQHALGPAFVLSEEEKALAAAVTDSGRWDREVAGLSVVGLWISHGRSELALTADDLDLYRQLFPHPWQVVLVLKPQMDGVPKGAFFFRANGSVAPHRRAHEFFTDPNFTAVAEELAGPGFEGGLRGKYKPVMKQRRGEIAGAKEEASPETFREPSSRLAARPLWIALTVALLAGTLLGYGLRSFLVAGKTVKPHDSELTLEVFDAGPQLLVHWNAHSWDVDHARSGQLTIESAGGATPIDLGVRDLVTGYIRLIPPNADTTVTLRIVEDNGHIEEQQRFWVPGMTGAARKR